MSPVLLQSLTIPARSAPLLLILLLAVLLTLAEQRGVLGIPVWVIGVSWFLKYAFVLADHVIEGRPDPPVLSIEMVSPFEQRPLGTFALLGAAWSGTGALGSHVGENALFAMRLALLAVLPAMIAAMCIGGRIVDALNPVTVFAIPRRMARAYVMLVLCLAGAWTGAFVLLRPFVHRVVSGLDWQSVLLGYAFSGIGANLAVLGAHVLLMYLWLASLTGIAATVYAHRSELGLEATLTPERHAAREAAELERKRLRIWDRVYAEARGGSLENAGETLRKLLAETPHPVDDCRWLYARALALGHEPLANRVAQLGVSRLLDAGTTGAALDLARDRLRSGAAFAAHTAGEALRLAELARAAGDRATARRLLADFQRLYPGDPLGPVAAKMQAELP